VERLEARDVPAGGCTLGIDGTLTITGTSANDDIRVYPSGSDVLVEMTHSGHSHVWEHPADGVSKIVVRGYGGDDYVLNDTAEFSEYYMGGGNDTVDGGWGDDVIHGEDGNDTLRGWFGQDELYGEDGTDALYGEEGNDTLDGGYERNLRDYLHGGPGFDTFVQHYFNSFFGNKTRYYEDIADYEPWNGDTLVWKHHGWW
jgi:Ca2+-binding RTX toxin-like protein